MAFRYRVTKPCYYGSVYREPGGKHSTVSVEKKFKKGEQPGHFELINEKAEAKKIEAKAEPELSDLLGKESEQGAAASNATVI